MTSISTEISTTHDYSSSNHTHDRTQSRATFFTRLLTLIAVALLVAAAVQLASTSREDDFPHDGIIMILAAALSLGVALLTARRVAQPALMLPTETSVTPARIAWLPVLGGAFALLVLGEINGNRFNLDIFQEVASSLQVWLLYIGVALVVWGLAGAPLPKLRLPAINKWEALAVVVIVALALFLRVWQLDTLVRVLLDELHFSDGIRGVDWAPYRPILHPMSGQSPYTWLYSYWAADLAHVVGRNLTGLRLVSALGGTATVFAVYLMARALFDRKTALIAGLLIAVFPPHLHYSRMALNQIGDALFGTMALAFIARGLKYNKAGDWAIAGASLGLTQYFFEAGRILFPPLVAGWIGMMLIFTPGHLRRQWRGLVILVIGAALVALPVYYTLLAQDRPLFGRMNESGLGFTYWFDVVSDGLTEYEFNEAVIRLRRPFMLHIFYPEGGGVYYGGEQPLVLIPLTPLFLLGTFYLMYRLRSPAFIVFAWAFITTLGNALFLRDNIVTPRYVVSMPALALLMAVGIRYIPPMIWHFGEAVTLPQKFWRYALPFGLAGVATVGQAYYYFGPHLETLNAQARDFHGYRDGIDAALRVAELPDPYGVQPILVGMPEHDQNVPRNFLGYMLVEEDYPLLSVRPDQFTPRYLINLPRDRDYAFFVDVTDSNVVDLIYRYFPNVQPPQYTTTDMHPDREYVLFFAPRSLYDLYRPVKAGVGASP